MNKGKHVLAVVVGAVAGMLLIYLGEYIFQFIYPFPASIDRADPSAMTIYIRQLPTMAFVVVLLTYAIGAFAGGIASTLLSQRITPVPAFIAGTILTLANLMNVMTVPQPMWFNIASMIIYIPFAYLGFRASARKPIVI